MDEGQVATELAIRTADRTLTEIQKSPVFTEYIERIARDGLPAANAWLHDTAVRAWDYMRRSLDALVRGRLI